MKIGVLALQGAFIEHENVIKKLGAECVEIRQKSDLEGIDGIILPGGESTVQGKLLRKLGMMDILRDKIKNGLPVLATCAGLILLAEDIDNDDNRYLGTLPVSVKRNAYGRQLGSFETTQKVGDFEDFPLVFIRAPYVSEAGAGVQVLAQVDGKIVGVRYGKQIGLAFHPEISEDVRIHREFLEGIKINN